MCTNEVIEIKEDIVNKVVISIEQVEFSSNESLNLVISNNVVKIEIFVFSLTLRRKRSYLKIPLDIL